MTARRAADVVQPLQETLAAEHAAVFVYATLAARVSVTSEATLWEALRAGHDTHRAFRDQLSLLITDAGGSPVPAEPAYELAVPSDSAQVRAAARATEEACAQAYAWHVAHTVEELRSWAISALTWSAVHAVRLGSEPAVWPGAAEL